MPFIQEVSTVIGALADVRALALSPDGDCFVATGQGAFRWDGESWAPLAVESALASNDIAFDASGVMATAGSHGATVDGAGVSFQVETEIGFVGPRAGGGFWLAGPAFAGYFDGTLHILEELDGRDTRAIVDVPGGWVAATAQGVLTSTGPVITGLPSLDVRDVQLRGSEVWAGTAGGLAKLEGTAWKPFLGTDGLHYGDITDLAVAEDVLLVSTTMGATRYHADGARRYYFGRNWVPDNNVRRMAAAGDGTYWFATSGGVSRVSPESTTLADKARRFDDITHERHVRLGYTSTENHLAVVGDETSYSNHDDDNDGQWTGMYLASQCFRFAVTGDELAAESARAAANALLRLHRVDGMDGFFARSVVSPEDCDAKQAAGSGEWHLSGDGQWCWKGDTSSDELVGHVFGLSLFHDLVASEAERAEVAASVGTLVGGMIDNGYQLLDVDGEVTSHGHFDPEWMHNNLAAKFGDAGLNSAMILGAMHAAFRMTGDSRFRASFDYLARTENYADYVRRIEEIGTSYLINHDSEEMSFLAMYTLIRYEDDPARMAQWQEGLRYLWEVQRPERNPEFNLMYAALSRSDEYDLDQSIETLQKLPRELILWGLDHSHRWDGEEQVNKDRHGRPQNVFVFPYDERQVMRWSENPYVYEQRGSGNQEAAGTFWLLPYWLGRYHGLIR